MAFVRGDAAARFLDLLAEPDFLKVVVMIAQVPKIVSAHATGPDGSIRIDMRADPTGVALDDLIFLVQNALDELLVLDSDCFRELSHARKALALDKGDESIDSLRIILRTRGDAQTNSVQFHSWLCNFRNELIRARFVGVSNQFIQMANAEHGNH